MKSFWIVLLITAVVASACQQAPDESQLPTLAILPSVTPTESSVQSVDSSPTPQPETGETATLAPTVQPATSTPVPVGAGPTEAPPTLPPPSATSIFTPTNTLIPLAAGEIRRATLTPVPPGGNVPIGSGSQVMADLAITEGEFQREVLQAVSTMDSVQNAEIDFVPEGIDVTLTALGGQAFVTGKVLVEIRMSGTFAAFSIAEMEVNGGEPSESFQEIATQEFFPSIVNALDTILSARLGDNHNLENIVMTDTEMRVFLLVPQS
jgi:hypothetical protein